MTIELLAPAGNLKTALYALREGADAVYCGLGEFSARASALNLSMLELRRLKAFAGREGKRVYITLNTVVTQSELPRVRRLLTELSLVEVDGVIIQDFGVLELLREEFPRLAIHISTQMAVHNVEGARQLAELGVGRMVLARELSLAEIAQIRHALPHVPLEVFCHGALCYSFSGLCLASGLMLGRSANRGRCAQVCRTYFQRENSAESGTYFSMNDLALWERINDLKQLGVASLKIEGRMKDPVYVTEVIKLYRAILDQPPGHTQKPDIADLKLSTQLTFSRTPTTAYAENPKGKLLVNSRYASHMGAPAGKILSVQGQRLTLKITLPLRLHDKLMFLPTAQKNMVVDKETVRGGRIVLLLNEQGTRCGEASANTTIQVEVEGEPPTDNDGFLVYLVKRDEPGCRKLAGLDEKQFPLYTKPLHMSVTIDERGFTLAAEPFLGGEQTNVRYDATVSAATGDMDLHARILALFAASGSSLYRVSAVTLTNNSGIEPPFIPPSHWKMAKKGFYEAVEKTVEQMLEGSAQHEAFVDAIGAPEPFPWHAQATKRMELNPTSQRHGRRIPFLMPSAPCDPQTLGRLGPYYVIPLPPVLFDSPAYFARITAMIASHSDLSFLVGLNNIGHLEPCLRLLLPYANCSFFLDYHLYIASEKSRSFFTRRLARIAFFYQWIEDSDCHVTGGVTIDGPRNLPLFISRCCHRRHVVSPHGDCPKGCTGKDSVPLKNGERSFDLVTDDCISFLCERTTII